MRKSQASNHGPNGRSNKKPTFLEMEMGNQRCITPVQQGGPHNRDEESDDSGSLQDFLNEVTGAGAVSSKIDEQKHRSPSPSDIIVPVFGERPWKLGHYAPKRKAKTRSRLRMETGSSDEGASPDAVARLMARGGRGGGGPAVPHPAASRGSSEHGPLLPALPAPPHLAGRGPGTGGRVRARLSFDLAGELDGATGGRYPDAENARRGPGGDPNRGGGGATGADNPARDLVLEDEEEEDGGEEVPTTLQRVAALWAAAEEGGGP